MRVLLDQNLSPKPIRKLADILPGLESVYDHALTGSSDRFIFEWARRSKFSTLVSTDRDFVRLAERFGPPPKVIRIERCDFPSRTPSVYVPKVLRHGGNPAARRQRPDSRLYTICSTTSKHITTQIYDKQRRAVKDSAGHKMPI